MGMLFYIHGVKFKLSGGICLRLWKSNYAQLGDQFLPQKLCEYFGGAGGEIGFYNSNNKLKKSGSVEMKGYKFNFDTSESVDIDAVMTSDESLAKSFYEKVYP